MTTRNFYLDGEFFQADASGTVTFNGVEIHNGVWNGPVDVEETDIVDATLDLDDSAGVDFTVPVTVTCTSGSVLIGLFEFDYAQVPNPAMTQEQFDAINDPATPGSERLAIFEAVANPPFNAEEIAILETPNPDAATQEVQYDILYAHDALSYIQDPSIFTYGLTPELCFCNRTNVLVNGVTPPNATTNIPIELQPGDVMTFDQIVFPSKIAYAHSAASTGL